MLRGSVEQSKILDGMGAKTELPEALLFDLDRDGRIACVHIYIKQPPTRRAGERNRAR